MTARVVMLIYQRGHTYLSMAKGQN
jgi:hypothetical protein